MAVIVCTLGAELEENINGCSGGGVMMRLLFAPVLFGRVASQFESFAFAVSSAIFSCAAFSWVSNGSVAVFSSTSSASMRSYGRVIPR